MWRLQFCSHCTKPPLLYRKWRFCAIQLKRLSLKKSYHVSCQTLFIIINKSNITISKYNGISYSFKSCINDIGLYIFKDFWKLKLNEQYPRSCSLCDDNLTNSCDLNNHMQNHSFKVKSFRDYKCEECDFVFESIDK